MAPAPVVEDSSTSSRSPAMAWLSLLVPKTAKGKLLKIRIKIVSGSQSATRTVTYTVR